MKGYYNLEPPYIVKHEGHFAKLSLQPLALQSNNGFSRTELSRIQQAILDARDQLLKHWASAKGSERRGVAARTTGVCQTGLPAITKLAVMPPSTGRMVGPHELLFGAHAEDHGLGLGIRFSARSSAQRQDREGRVLPSRVRRGP